MVNRLAKILFIFIIFLDKSLYFLTKRQFRFHLYELLRENYKEVKIEDKKISFFCPSVTSSWRADTFHTKEPETLKWIDGFDNTNETIFWDIGANVGLYSIYTAVKKNNIKIISFEPSSLNLNLLSKNISINNLSNRISIYQIALSKFENKFMLFNESTDSEGGALSSFGVNYNYEGKKFDVVKDYNIFGNSINYLLRNKILDVPNYIKIDVDGIEHLIIKGADEFLTNKKIRSIQVELNENFKEQYDEVCSILKRSGFKMVNDKEYQNKKSDKRFENTFNFLFMRI